MDWTGLGLNVFFCHGSYIVNMEIIIFDVILGLLFLYLEKIDSIFVILCVSDDIFTFF